MHLGCPGADSPPATTVSRPILRYPWQAYIYGYDSNTLSYSLALGSGTPRLLGYRSNLSPGPSNPLGETEGEIPPEMGPTRALGGARIVKTPF